MFCIAFVIISLVFSGTCVDVWGTHMCECPLKTAAKDCSQVIDDPVRMEGAGIQTYLNTSLPSSTVFFPWYNGISVRTRAREGVLMHIVIAGNQHVTMEVRVGWGSPVMSLRLLLHVVFIFLRPILGIFGDEAL